MLEEISVHEVWPRRVCITGAVYPSTGYLIAELLLLKQLHTSGGITISLHQNDVNKYAGK